jgi:2-polyprenyl-3-methyl-5-hydroxy-6-metoxy-1,4-benzoquinol methylase
MRMPGIRRLGRPALRDHYDERRVASALTDRLTDDDLDRLNNLLPWRCFTVDAQGRPLGGTAWRGKRDRPEQIPDPRIQLFHDRFDLSDKHVLEVGCFEGIHTIALCKLAERVTAVDVRVENVAKTAVRCAFFDVRPRVAVCDVEAAENDELLRSDLCHHVGVLYHLDDPVSHLLRLGTWISRGIILDTHYSAEEDAIEEYTVGGQSFRYHPYREGGRRDVFSGVRPSSKWLRLEDIKALLHEAGFGIVEVVEKRDERNGPRVLLFAARESG